MEKELTYEELEREVIALRKTVSKNDYMERVFHSIANVIMLLDPDHTILSVNHATEKLTGKSNKELMGKKCFEVFHHSETHPEMCPMQKLIQSGKLETMEMEVEALGKSFLVSCSPVFDEKSNLKRIIHICTDITERKRIEEDLRHSREKYTKLFQYSNDAIFIHDTEGNILDVNQKALELLGYTLSELTSLTSPMLHPPEMLPKVKTILESIMEKGAVFFDIDFLKKDGRAIPTEVSARLFDIGGKNVIQGIVRDISERIKTENEKRHIDEKYKTLFAVSGDGILVVEIESTKFVEANPAMCTMLGYTKEELLKKSLRDMHPEESFDFAKEEFLAQAKGDKLVSQNIPCLTKQGTVFLADISTVQTKVMGIDCNIGFFRDVTAIRQIEDKLQQTQKMEAIGILAGGIAHDFNNMLGVITGNISFAKSSLAKEDELYNILSDVEVSSQRAQSLTHQLLTFSKGGEPIKKVKNINPLINEAAVFSLRGTDATLRFDLSEDLWAVEIDEGQFNQVISNIVINANQAMPKGGTIAVRTENVAIDKTSDLPLTAGRYIKISIEDQGIGISKKHLANIFDPYFTTKQKGSGLGLATSYSIINKHGGHITADSNIDKGAVFTTYLPASSKTISETMDQKSPKHAGSGTILIMDDQEAILKMAGRILKIIGYDARFAKDGKQAVEIYNEAFQAKKPFDLVILDLTIPGGMGGAKTIIELLNVDPNVKAVVSSGYSNDPIMANYKDYGFCGVVSKPYTKDQLAEVLNRILGGKK